MQGFRVRSLVLVVLGSIVSLALLACSSDGKNVGVGPHIKVSLLSDQSSVRAGVPFHVGVLFSPEPGWHVYWKNPGDSGLAPKFSWTHSEALSLASPLWPTPSRIEVGTLVNYGYDETLIAFPATIAPSAKEGTLEVTVKASWLVCKDECLPGSATLTLPVSVNHSGSPEPSQSVDLFTKYLSLVPPPIERVALAVEEREDHVVLSLLPLNQQKLPKEALFFPEDQGIINNSAPQLSKLEGGTLQISLTRDSNRSAPVERIRGVLFSAQGWSPSGLPKAVSIDTDNHQNEPSAASNSGTSNTVQNTIDTSTSSSTTSNTPRAESYLLTLLMALVGGFILNLMPCVFPVLSIKILGFIQCSKECSKTVKRHGIAFSIGVIASFLALAVVLLTLRAGGAQLGWGFQLQSPGFVLLMIGVFFILGLTFLVELNFGSKIQTLACKGKTGPSLSGSFFSGVLATAVATPCTAPFMGSALAATITLPTSLSLLVFLFLGIGMSIPYLILTFQPRLLCYLPKPGEWMVTFKQVMAFPMFATAVWLMKVFGRQIGIHNSTIGLLMNVLWGLLIAAFAIWLVARTQHARSRFGITMGKVSSLLLLAGAGWTAYPSPQALHNVAVTRSRSATPTAGQNATEVDQFGLEWEHFSSVRLQELLNQQRAVFLDFTAEWCITCKVNERVVFGSAEVRELLRRKNVALVKGDWTSMDGEITKTLEKFGRNGVPLNVIYKGGALSKEPVILPNILTPGVVIKELEAIPE